MKKINLAIQKYDADRDKIYLRPLMKENVIPGFGNSLICGATNSGKTMTLVNLFLRPEFYGPIKEKPYHDVIYLFCFSPSKLLVKNLEGILWEKNIFTKPDPEPLGRIFDKQKKLINELGFDKAPHIAIILDDVISHPKFLRSPLIGQLFFQGTNAKISTYICTQGYKSVPRAYRLNCHYLIAYIWNMSDSEVERIADEYCPAGYKKNEFKQIISQACSAKFSFLFVNNRLEPKDKYRVNFEQIIELPNIPSNTFIENFDGVHDQGT